MLFHKILSMAKKGGLWANWDGSADGLTCVFDSSQSYFISACKLSETKVLVAYRDSGNSYYGTAVVLTISGTTITAGTPFVFCGANAAYISVCALSETTACVAYRNGSIIAGWVCLLSISGSTVSLLNAKALNGGDIAAVTACTLSDNKALVTYQDGKSSTYYGTAVIVTVSGSTIALGTPFVFKSATTTYISACRLSDTKALVAYGDPGNSSRGAAVVLSVSGTTITGGTHVVFCAANAAYISVCSISELIAVATYRNGTTSGAIVFSVSGTTITLGASVDFNSGDITGSSVCGLSSSKILVAYQSVVNGHGTAAVLAVSGMTISVETLVVFENSEIEYITALLLSDEKVVVAYQDTGNNYVGSAIVLQSN